jgi:branched-chain amino acid transport system substrate-binding protein
VGSRRWIGALALAAVVATGCSEPEPEASDTTDGTDTSTGTGDGSRADACPDLLACAREGTLADFVPDEPTAADGEPIVLGMINQDNTPAGSFPELSGAVQAGVEWLNEEMGGIDGRPVEVQVCNTEFSPEGSTACAQRFVELGVPVVVGGIDVFGNAIDTLEDNGIPYVGGIPVSTQSSVSPVSFQWSGGTWGATVAFAEHAITEVEAERVSILYGEFGSIAESGQYGREVLEAAGVEVQLVPYPILATDLAAPLEAAAATDPDAVIVLAADTGCRPAFEGLAALDLDVTAYFVGACAAPTIIDALGPEVTEGAVFNVEGPVDPEIPQPDFDLYFGVVERYGDGLDPVGAGTVSFRSFMNLYVILRELGADGISSEAIIDALQAKEDEPSFMGHPYTCDGSDFPDLPALCSPQQVLVQIQDGTLTQISDWIDVGAVYRR